MFKAIGNVIGAVFGSENTVNKTIDLIDSWHTSEPEAIAAKTKAKVALLASYAPFKRAQRLIAIPGWYVFLSLFVYCAVRAIHDGNTQNIRVVVDVINAFGMDLIMALIIGFYFGGGAFEGLAERFRDFKEAKDGKNSDKIEK